MQHMRNVVEVGVGAIRQAARQNHADRFQARKPGLLVESFARRECPVRGEHALHVDHNRSLDLEGQFVSGDRAREFGRGLGLNVDHVNLAFTTQQPAVPDQADEVPNGPLCLLRTIHRHEKSVHCRSPFHSLGRVTAGF